MAGNSFGYSFKIMTFGESHGKCVGVVIDGCPSGLELDLGKVQAELNRRRPGQSAVTTPRNERDRIKVYSGLFKGKTTGTPLGFMISNENVDSGSYENISDKFRPGHADYTYWKKYGIRDWRGGGRASARETAARVMAGAVAKQVLEKYSGIQIFGATVCVGGIEAKARDYKYSESNILRCPDSEVYELMMDRVRKARLAKDSIGGAVEVVAKHVPAGLGEPVFDKLNAVLMHALGSIGAVKAVGIGKGREVENMLGSEYQDQKVWVGKEMCYFSNNAGGMEGGISNGEDVVARLSVKPTPTRAGVKMTLPDEKYKNEDVIIKGRHDPIIMPRLVPVAEAMMAATLVDFLIRQKAYTFRG
ncbi:MAG: chorismate synthase [archaeon]